MEEASNKTDSVTEEANTDLLEGANVHWDDVVVIIVYFTFVLAVGVFSAYRSKRGSVTGYYLASRNMHWIPVGASLFASNIGSGHFIGLAGAGAKSGIAIANMELNAVFILMILGWVFVPVYMASGVYTMPEYLMKRFGGQRIRVYLSVLAILLYVFTKISVDIFAGAIFIKQSLNWDIYLSTVVLLLVAGIFTISGGLTAVIWTDFVQTILMVIGAFVLMVKSFLMVGGYDELITNYMTSTTSPNVTSYDSNNVSCSAIPDDAMHLFRSASSPDLPWTGITFGLTVSAVWYWCSDQVIVQRAIAAKNLSHAKAGTLLAGVLKLLPLFLLVFPGMAARVLFADKVGCATPESCRDTCNSESGCTNIAYPLLVIHLMPRGLRGLMLSVMLAALMSSLTSIFNSSSTIFAIDIWTRIRKNASDFELLLVGRLFVVVLVIISVLWIPILEAAHGGQLFHYMQSITSFLAPPVCAVYVLAVSWKRINEKGAFWGLMIGLIIGLTRFIWEYSYTVPPCGSSEPDPRPGIIKDLHYLHFGILLFCIVAMVTIAISLTTKAIPDECLHRLTFSSRFSREVRTDIQEYQECSKDMEMKSKSANTDDENGKLTEAKTNGDEVFEAVDVDSENKANEDQTGDDESGKGASQESLLVRAIYCICGFNPSDVKKKNKQKHKALKKSHEEQMKDADAIIENPMWSQACAAGAIVLIAIAAFIHGMYA